jgi:nucleolar protein 58
VINGTRILNAPKMARMVATKAALSIRFDALADVDSKSDPLAPSIGIENRAKLESRLRALESQGETAGVKRFQSGPKKQLRFEMSGGTKTYNVATDAVDLVSTQRQPMEVAVEAVLDVKAEKKRAKEERRALRRAEKEKSKEAVSADSMAVDHDLEEKEKKEKKRKRTESEVNGEASEVKVGFLPSLFCL